MPNHKIDNSRLLTAGHIKPWSHSSNEEKLNPKNGILLSPLFDKLFDMRVGLITLPR
ncbi:MAG: HNH endonuclease [Candidatus Thiodubiliella endoseptemdiera]|uniref:HNH endonuclease n=1 Tax=Candidatus Thiodubiliella endoseptemdiera TaxID=2738886 RepID=A0A853F514_9GAMM|nr:HNH endonuclease [Candidatus Thiodubiliella endoseptemdiera]